MPNGIVPDEGLADELLSILINPMTEFAAWSLLLWVNNYVPDDATTLADLEEPTFTGYSRRSLIAADWGVPVVAAHVATSTWGTVPQVWTNGGATSVSVFGCAYYDTVAAVLRYVERFDVADIVAVAPGGTIAVTPRFTYRSQLASE